jgi:hypothetical protein
LWHTKQDKKRQGKTRKGKANKTTQDQRQDKLRQDKASQAKTTQNKTANHSYRRDDKTRLSRHNKNEGVRQEKARLDKEGHHS